MKHDLHKLLLGVFFVFAFADMFAQAQNVSGKVTGSDFGEGIPGVTVVEKGTNNGTVTDLDGNYTLSVSGEGENTLVFSFIGYVTQEIAIGSRTTIDVELQISMTELSEIVVIGYGTQKKKVVTGSIASISAEEITSTPILRIEQALQGRTPGVQVTNLSGQPGEAPTIRIRGAGTTGDAAPLYIVDGMAVGGIDYLNPSDIESIDVLKDAASAAIYGARAANGVVLITTKSGVKGSVKVSYSGYTGIQNVSKKLEMLNASDYKMMMNEGARNANRTEPFDLNEISVYDTDWHDELFQTNAPMSDHQISVSGGSEKSTFASSLSYFTQQGIIGGEKSQFDRYTARIKANHKVNEIFNFGNNFAYSHIIRRGIGSNQSFNGAYSSALNLDPLTPLFETDQNKLALPPYSNEPVIKDSDGNIFGISEYVGAEIVNPLALIETQTGETRVDKFVANVFGELEPIKDLKYKSSLGIDLAYVLGDSYRPLFYLNGAQNNIIKTSVNKNIDRYFTWQWENTLTYSKKIDDHNIGGLVGISAREEKFENLTGFNADVDVSNPDHVYLSTAQDTVWTANGGAWHKALYSLFGRVTYDYKDKYSLTAILRRDGSSNFGPNNRYGIFPSLGLAWIASDEAFLQDYLGPVNLLKIRASWGINGNDKIGLYPFVSSIIKNRGYTFAAGREVGSSPGQIANGDIHWEESQQIGVGIDLGLFENKLTASIDYYDKTTKDLLEIIPIPAHVGNDAPFANVGSVQNQGLEIALNWRTSSTDFDYSIGINAGYNKNQMTKIANTEGVIHGASWAIAGEVTQAIEGLPIAYFWGYKTDGIFQNQAEIFQHLNSEGDLLQPSAKPGDVRFVDFDKDGSIGTGDRTLIGNPTPDWTLGMNASVKYKGFDASVLLTGTIGNDLFNGMQRRDLQFTNRPVSILDRWTGEGSTNDQPRFTWSDTNNNNRISDLYIEDGSYVRIKNLQIGYTMPSSLLEKIKSSNWRVYISAENLFTFTSYTGADPEIGAMSAFDIGIDRGIYPQARTFRVGTSITF